MSVNITAADVKKLREMTGAGMMDCKKALSEAEGDFEKAIELLRKQGQKVSAKRADREANEGVVIAEVSDDNKRGVIVKLSCETDFVGKGEDFVGFAQKAASLALKHFPNSLEELLKIDMDGLSLGDRVTELVGKLDEKIELAAYEKMEAAMVCPYIHMGNKAAVLIGLNKASDDFYDAGRDVAMQVAAMKPVAVDKDGVDAGTIEKEIEIGKEQARQEGKPEQILEKIAQGKLQKFFKDSTLLNQQFVKDNKHSVREYLHSFDKDLTVIAFEHVTLG